MTKAKYVKGGDLPTGTIPAYTYCHSSDNKDRIREETAALFDLMFRCSDCFSLTITEWYKTLPLTMQQRKNPLRDALKPYFVQKFSAYNWYVMSCWNAPPRACVSASGSWTTACACVSS